MIISNFNYDGGVIISGDSYTTPLTQVEGGGFYISLKCDVVMELKVMFSNDGITFNLQEILFYGTDILENIPTKSKFVIIKIKNISSGNASIINLSGWSTSNVESNNESVTLGSVLPKNIFGDLSVSEPKLLTNYKWTSGQYNAVPVTFSSGNLKTGYSSIELQSNNSALSYAQLSQTGLLNLCSGNGDLWSRIVGKPDLYQSGVPMIFRFTSMFYDNNDPYRKLYIGIGNFRNSITKNISNFIGVGYKGDGIGVSQFGIFYIRNVVETFISLDDFDMKINGDNKYGFIFDPTKGNIWQINVAYLGFSDISIQLYIDGEFRTVHTLKFSNSSLQTSFTDPSFRFLMTYEVLVGPALAPGLPLVGNGSYGALSYSEYNTSDFHCYDRTQTILANTETVVFGIQNPGVWFGRQNPILCSPVLLSMASDGTKSCLIKIYGGITSSIVSGGAWVDVDENYTPVQANTTCTKVVGAKELFSFVISKIDKAIIDMNSFNFFANGNTCWLVTVISTGASDILSSITWKEIH